MKVILDDFMTIFKGHQMQSKPIYNSEGISISESIFCEWQDVQNLFFYQTTMTGKESLLVFCKDRQVYIRLISRKEFYNNINTIYGYWKAKAQCEDEFNYSRYYAAKDILSCKVFAVVTGIFFWVILTLLLMNLNKFDFTDINHLVMVFVPLILLLLFTLFFLSAASMNRYYDLTIKDKSIFVENNKGQKIFTIHDITKCLLNRVTGNKLCFADGTKVFRLEQLSYWPILREKLKALGV